MEQNQIGGNAAIEKQEMIDDAMRHYTDMQAQAKHEAQQNSRYIKLKDGEQTTFTLTGKVTSVMKEFEAGKGQKEMFNFFLSELNQKGEEKVFSTSVRSAVCGELLAAIKANKLHIAIKRSGNGNSTTYLVMASV